MTDEQRERILDRLLENQAHHDAVLRKLEESYAHHDVFLRIKGITMWSCKSCRNSR